PPAWLARSCSESRHLRCRKILPCISCLRPPLYHQRLWFRWIARQAVRGVRDARIPAVLAQTHESARLWRRTLIRPFASRKHDRDSNQTLESLLRARHAPALEHERGRTRRIAHCTARAGRPPQPRQSGRKAPHSGSPQRPGRRTHDPSNRLLIDGREAERGWQRLANRQECCGEHSQKEPEPRIIARG